MAVRGMKSTLAGRETSKRRTAPKARKAEKKSAPAEPEQMTNEQLAADNPTAELPAAVVGDRMAVRYVKPHFDVDKDDHRTVAVELSLPLGDEHKALHGAHCGG